MKYLVEIRRKRKNDGIAIILFLLLFSFSSCFKPQTFPKEPNIEFIDFIVKDTFDILQNRVLNGTLHFYFVDGDGDIGYDTTSPRQNTIFLKKYKIENKQEVLINMQVPLEYFVPKFKRNIQDEALQGEMFVKNLNETFPFENDTIMYKFYIKDRAGNKSNVASTGYIIVNNYLQ